MKILLLFLLLFVFFYGCNTETSSESDEQETPADSTIGTIEWFDSSAAEAIDKQAAIEVIGKNFNWAEGPLWIAEKNILLFSDVPENKIFQWKNGDTTSLYITPSGYTGKAGATGEIGSNGLSLDTNNALLLCQSGNRQVARMNAPTNAPQPDFTALASTYQGKRFNSPNDLITDSKNNIYFTDPVYGLPNGENDTARDMRFEGVYKIHTDGKLSLLIDSIPRPNGIALSPDETTLYIASSDEYKPAWYAYRLDKNGNIMSGGILLNALPLKKAATQKQGPDGMKTDKHGNLFGAGPDGINVITPAGRRIALIKIYNRVTSNCSFSATKDTLYITADDWVLRVKVR